MLKLRLFAGLLILTVPVHAVVFNLVAPPTPVAKGADVQLNLLILNPAEMETMVELPSVLAGTLSDSNQSWVVQLDTHAMGGVVAVSAGGFAVREYRVKLPPNASGRLVLEIQVPVAAKVAIETQDGLMGNIPRRH